LLAAPILAVDNGIAGADGAEAHAVERGFEHRKGREPLDCTGLVADEHDVHLVVEIGREALPGGRFVVRLVDREHTPAVSTRQLGDTHGRGRQV